MNRTRQFSRISLMMGGSLLGLLLQNPSTPRRTSISEPAANPGFASLAPSPPRFKQVSVVRKQQVQESYRKRPLAFEANQGQSDPEVKFLSRGKGYTMFLTCGGLALALSKNPSILRQEITTNEMPDRKTADFEKPTSA